MINITSVLGVVNYAKKSWSATKAIVVAGTAVSAAAAGVITGKIYSGNRKRITDVERKVGMIYSDLYEDSSNNEPCTEDDSGDSGDIVDLGFAPSKEDVDAAT
jgi:hypothetical protein